MTVEAAVFSLLGPLVSQRCYPDVTPENPTFPLIIYQVVGGEAKDYLERRLPDCEHYRVQVFCWSKSRAEASALALNVRQQIIEQGKDKFPSASTVGQRVSQYEDVLKLYGTRQDFSVWIKER
ncbi:tail completion protein gp17 [Paenalcaligenes suwonensis]|uniref:tail completion protein gp17 n=1 Tax=Paenalcaligenes suwonensis TaxID=1202713 RepID=UPI00140DBD00|nr:DUF3168 domain-containing protein [Paenalcaligenes suwonensis]NHC63104.1 DUF3168 domain-containing protein [Paenalcaligenes suwonensis]